MFRVQGLGFPKKLKNGGGLGHTAPFELLQMGFLRAKGFKKLGLQGFGLDPSEIS